uniref:Uncharacterized protein n=1 Tax=Cacopsylla melanoneura TaxID=428564 RepID=A0A8D8SXZ1_9HEMI
MSGVGFSGLTISTCPTVVVFISEAMLPFLLWSSSVSVFSHNGNTPISSLVFKCFSFQSQWQCPSFLLCGHPRPLDPSASNIISQLFLNSFKFVFLLLLLLQKDHIFCYRNFGRDLGLFLYKFSFVLASVPILGIP